MSKGTSSYWACARSFCTLIIERSYRPRTRNPIQISWRQTEPCTQKIWSCSLKFLTSGNLLQRTWCNIPFSEQKMQISETRLNLVCYLVRTRSKPKVQISWEEDITCSRRLDLVPLNFGSLGTYCQKQDKSLEAHGTVWVPQDPNQRSHL